jgi:signal transduction histidine kinase
MNFRNTLRDFIIGRGIFISSRPAYKSAMLRGQLCLVFISVTVLYIFIDWSKGVTGFEIFYLVGAVIGMVSFWLNRIGKHKASNIVLLFAANALAYIFASNDTHKAGTYIYFIVTSLVAFSLFGFEGRRKAFLFSLLSFALFIAAYILEIKVITITPEQAVLVYSEGYIRTTFITNFSIALMVSSCIFYFLLDVNHYSENEIMRKNELLSKTNQELDRFVYSASHDLKAPLSSMQGLIDIAQRTDDPEEVKMCLRMMKERVLNLDAFILEIIDYSRNSRLELKKEKFNLMDLVMEVVDSLRYAEGFENIYLKYNMPRELEIESDRSRLKVVLNNLIGNSLKYHDPAKENPLIEISAVQQNGRLKIEIQDNGVGIATEHTPKVFDMFYRASEKSKGSGLGLYIVKETVEKMNGRISVESQLGSGTKFTVQLILN